MQKINRSKCLVSGSTNVNTIYTLRNFPIIMSCVDFSSEEDIFEDMNWSVSESGYVQLLEMLDPDLIYKNYHSPGLTGKIWQEHHQKFSEFINEDTFINALEIGGGSGVLANKISESYNGFTWTLIEPSIRKTFSDHRIKTINSYFETHEFTKKYDIVVHSHCFEHAYDPINFLNKINSVLEDGGLHYISIPNMRHWLTQGFTNTLSFEHTFYVDYDVVSYFLSRSGFRLLDSIITDHSIFFKARKEGNCTPVHKDFSYVKRLFDEYKLKISEDTENIIRLTEGKKVYLFGAHIFAQVLLNMGLSESRIICLLDNDPNKHGKRLYGTNLTVKSPLCLSDVAAPVVIVRGGSYTDEIKESIVSINPNTKFI